MRILLTGAAGFIGFHTSRTLLERGDEVWGLDSVNDYYDPRHKEIRLKVLSDFDRFHFAKIDIRDHERLESFWKEADPEYVIHLAAQAGVRYSLTHPMAYIESNVEGFQRVIELARHRKPRNFVYASSSSVYGGNRELPFAESQDVSNPISLYAATKLSNELVARTYGHLYELPSVGLRFFTVYGPYSRPDMAMFKFADLMERGEPLPVFNHGKMIRDFTFYSDTVNGIIASLDVAEPGRVFNLGKGNPDQLSDMIRWLQEALGMEAKLEMLPMQAGDVAATVADVSLAKQELGYNPKIDLKEGIRQFAEWYSSPQRARC